jgi:hypothetical protein
MFIEHPPENSIASFDFTSAVLDEGTTFIFGFWICIANGSGGFNIHLADTSKLEASAATRCSNLDEFIDNLEEMLMISPGRSRKYLFSTRLQLMLHQYFSDRTQPDLRRGVPDSRSGYAMPPRSTRRLCGLSSSLTWRRT